MAQKYYAVKKGMNLKNGEDITNLIVTSWPECQSYIKGVKGAVYKSFLSLEEAQAYITANNNLKKGVDEYPEDVPHIYVDGSYNIGNGDYGYGIAVVNGGVVEYAAYANGHDEEDNQRQVNGELHGAVEGIRYSIKMGYKKIVLFYDYAGVCKHATGEWSRNTRLSKWYHEEVARLKQGHDIEIIFVKIDSHTGDLYNDVADELAKLGAGVEFVSAVDKALSKTMIQVKDEKTRDVLSLIVKKNVRKIFIYGVDDREAAVCIKDSSEESLKTEALEEENIDEIVEELLNCDEALLDKKLKSLKTKTKSSVIKCLVKKLK